MIRGNVMSEDLFLGGMFAALGVFFIFIFAVCVVFYVMKSLSLQNMAKKLNIENPWLAWLPVANLYILGKIAGDRLVLFGKEITNLGVVLLVGSIGASVLSAIPVIGWLLLIAYVVVAYAAYYKVYRIFNEGSATLYLVLTIVVSVVQPFLLFSLSKKEPDLAIFNEKQSESDNEYEYDFEDEDDTVEYVEDDSEDDFIK